MVLHEKAVGDQTCRNSMKMSTTRTARTASQNVAEDVVDEGRRRNRSGGQSVAVGVLQDRSIASVHDEVLHGRGGDLPRWATGVVPNHTMRAGRPVTTLVGDLEPAWLLEPRWLEPE